MKKLFSLLIILTLVAGVLAACGQKPAPTAPVPAESGTQAPATKPQQPVETTKAAPESTPAVPPETVPETLPAVPETTEAVPETLPVQPPETSPAVPESTEAIQETTVDHPQGGTGPADETTEAPPVPSTHAAVETETGSQGHLSKLRRYDENDRLAEETAYREDGKPYYTVRYEYYDDGAKKSESRQDYDENGLAGRYERIEYHEDGKSVRMQLTRSDQEYRYEYDARGRETLRQTMSLDGSELISRTRREYGGEDGDYVCTQDYRFPDGQKVHIEEIYKNNSLRQMISSIEGDGFWTKTVYDELGRCIQHDKYAPDGFLLASNEYQYYGESDQYSRYYYAKWSEEFGAYSETIYLYDEAGTPIHTTWREADGSREHHQNNAEGYEILRECFYPGDVPQQSIEYSYFPGSGQFSETTRTEWNEDGSFNYKITTTYYESGFKKSWHDVSGDGTVTYAEYLDGDLRTLYTVTKNGVLTSRESRAYHPDGSIARITREQFTEDGQPASLTEECYQENGDPASTRYVYVDGSSFYTEYKGGTSVLVRRWYPDGTLASYWYIDDEGISHQYSYYENGQPELHFEENGDIYLLYETYAESGALISRSTRTLDGFYEYCNFSETSGLMYYQKLKDATGIYVRNFEEGKPTREVRYAPDADGSYLGYTDWFYFEEGGVRKVRISVYDSSNTLVSETEEPEP